MADKKTRRAAASVDFKSLELANILQLENKVKEKEKLGGGVQFYLPWYSMYLLQLAKHPFY